MTWNCNCVGPQNGDPVCPCLMKERRVKLEPTELLDPDRDLDTMETVNDEILR